MGGMLAAVVGGGASSLATNMAWASAAWADEAEAEVEVGAGGVAGAGDGGVDGGAFDADATADVAADEVVMPAPPSNEEPPAPTSAPAKPKAAPAVRYKGTNWSVVAGGIPDGVSTSQAVSFLNSNPPHKHNIHIRLSTRVRALGTAVSSTSAASSPLTLIFESVRAPEV